MSQVSSMDDLKVRIEALEALQLKQTAELKSSALALMESVSPAQVLKATLKNVITTPGIRGDVIDTVLGLGAGFLGRKLYVRQSKNIVKKMAGTALQLFLTNFVSKKMHETREKTSETRVNGTY